MTLRLCGSFDVFFALKAAEVAALQSALEDAQAGSVADRKAVDDAKSNADIAARKLADAEKKVAEAVARAESLFEERGAARRATTVAEEKTAVAERELTAAKAEVASALARAEVSGWLFCIFQISSYRF